MFSWKKYGVGLLLVVLAGCGGNFDGKVFEEDLKNHAEDVEIEEGIDLSEQEIDDLVFMREEEKLAHDVYMDLYDKWGQKIFVNIANSEQTHTDSIGSLIAGFGLDDPYVEGRGEFENSDLAVLYGELVEQGSESLEEALRVGALIEDLDIMDLEEAMRNTTNTSILRVYENLQRGSRNHLRSFTSVLKGMGEEYAPSYLSEDEYLDIVGGERERGGGMKRGNN